MKNSIHKYAEQPDGRRNLGVDVGENVTVLVSPRSAEAQGEAERIAALVANHHAALESLRAQLAERDSLLATARARAASAEAARDAALTGRRRFFGRVLMKPATAGAWDGAVWLLDPEKQEHGLGLRFDSAAEVRSAHPELWVVGMSQDGVFLDAAPIRSQP